MKKSAERVPRTPRTEAVAALDIVWRCWVNLCSDLATKNPDDMEIAQLARPKVFFTSKIFREWKNDQDKIKAILADEFGSVFGADQSPESARHVLLQAMAGVVACANQTLAAENNGQRDQAWIYAADTSFWAGALVATWGERKFAINPATRLANKRHKEHYAMIEQAKEYWRKNINPTISASKAADRLQKVVPLSHKKLAEVIAVEKKKPL